MLSFMSTTYHIPVLVKEVLQYLDPKPGKLYIDATFGGGGHSRAILEKEPGCRVVALDWDLRAIEMNAQPLIEEFGDRFEVLYGSFSNITHVLKRAGIAYVDGILADFGTSQYQIFNRPGFSFSVDTPLDMRMSPGHHKTTAYDVLKHASEQELSEIFFEFGSESHGRKIARTIIARRQESGPLKTTRELAQLIERIVPRKGAIHPATKVFQALRIFVNQELKNIHALLTQSLDLLDHSGRIVCISFHSGEDVLVKTFFKNHSNVLEILTKNVVIAEPEEVASNASSRSAKLRAAVKR